MAKATLLLYPSAGSDREHPRLCAIESTVGASASVNRFDFPYRREGRKGPPDRAPKLMGSIRDDLASFARRRGPIIMGGHSMGGRRRRWLLPVSTKPGPFLDWLDSC